MGSNEVINFGCRLNAYEADVMKSNLEEASIKNTTIFNTCAVTKEAERQAKQAIRKYINTYGKDKKIIITGCSAQINPEFYQDIQPDLIIGNEEKLSPLIYQNLNSFIQHEEKVLVNDIMAIKETAFAPLATEQARARAFLQIQNGCNHRCTFCIIPYGRGNSRSVPMGEVIRNIKTLLDGGYKEIVLTGVDITDYGQDLPSKPTLGALLKRVFKMIKQNDFRLRLSSVDVAEICDDLRRIFEQEPRFMPYFHLSLQSGDDMILKRMKRRHRRHELLEFCHWTRKIRPETGIGADIIAGFPTETEEMFQNSLNIIAEAGLNFPHIFPYSEREGTPAAKIPPAKQVPKKIRKERAKLMREAGQIELQKLYKKMDGTRQKIIIEEGKPSKMGRLGEFGKLGEFNEIHRARAENFTEIYIKNNQFVGESVNHTADNRSEMIDDATHYETGKIYDAIVKYDASSQRLYVDNDATDATDVADATHCHG